MDTSSAMRPDVEGTERGKADEWKSGGSGGRCVELTMYVYVYVYILWVDDWYLAFMFSTSSGSGNFIVRH